MRSEGGYLMAKIHQIAGRVFARMLREHRIQLNPAQGRILFVLWQADDIPIQELARRTGLGKSTLTSMLDRLETAGHIERVTTSEDRRKLLIRRTDKDRALHALYAKVSREMTGVFYDGFSKKEIREFETHLRRVLANLESHERGPARSAPAAARKP